MFERFTSPARDAVIRAQQVARELRHPRIDTGHVLVALAANPPDIGTRALARVGFDPARARDALQGSLADSADALDHRDEEALRAVGIEVEDVRRAVEASFGRGALERARGRWLRRGHIPFTPEAKKALELSLREALQLGDRHIGTEHLLLGLLRERCSSAKTVLVEQGISVERLRHAVDAELTRRHSRGNTA
jgi:ATP-dependent Clp protease ATP-binding subunit ClpA